MLKVYCYSRCTTCKKALKWLDDNGIAYELTDIKTDHPDEDTLRKYHATSGLSLKRFWNTNGDCRSSDVLSETLMDMASFCDFLDTKLEDANKYYMELEDVHYEETGIQSWF